MANIVITLPQKLWWAISHGFKTYECRKTLPKGLHAKGKVYVVIKGTTKVAGCFTVDSFYSTNNFGEAWRYMGKKLFVERQWFVKYVVGHKGMIHLWQIGKVWTFDEVIDLEEYFGIKKNPQSYVYTFKEPYIRMTLQRVYDPERQKMLSPKHWARRDNTDDLPF